MSSQDQIIQDALRIAEVYYRVSAHVIPVDSLDLLGRADDCAAIKSDLQPNLSPNPSLGSNLGPNPAQPEPKPEPEPKPSAQITIKIWSQYHEDILIDRIVKHAHRCFVGVKHDVGVDR